MTARKRAKRKSRHPIEPAAVVAKPSPAKLSWQKKFVFSIVPLLVLLGVVEITCRISPRQGVDKTLSGLVEPDPDLLWRLAQPPGDRPQLNELNLHDGPYNEHADIKILLLGDSVSWGDSVLIGQGYPFVLERLLATAMPGQEIEVINAGVPGYSTFQEAKYLELYGLDLKPDLILLQFCLNDVVERYQVLAEYGGENSFLGLDTRQAARGVFGFMLRNSRAFEYFMRFLQGISRNRQAYDVMYLAKSPLSPELEAAWNKTLAEIDEIHEMAVANGIPMMIVIAPYRFQVAAPDELRQPQDRLMKFAEARGIPCVDLLPALAAIASGEQLPGEAFFLDDNHFSIEGHKRVAKALAAPVADSLGHAP